jgi:P4 family phage/plasmid primase-like protien
MITVWRDKYVKGWDGEAEPAADEWHETLPLVEALSRKYMRYDAHFVPYYLEQQDEATGVWSPLSECPRVNLVAMPRLPRWRVRLRYQYGVADVDCDAAHRHGIEVPESWRVRMRQLAMEAVPGSVVYDTRGGLRVIWSLPKPFGTDEFRDHMNRARAALLSAGLPVDDLTDTNRCYRLPFVLRDGRVEERWAAIHEPSIWEPPAPVVVEVPATTWDKITQVRERFQIPDTIEKGSRHTTLTRYAASLRAQNMGREEIKAKLWEADAERCDPPYQGSDEEGDLDGILDWACGLPPGPSADFAARREVAQIEQHVFDRGDSVEVAEWALAQIERPTMGLGVDNGPLPLVFAEGELRGYDPPSGRWRTVPEGSVLKTIMQSAGMPVFAGMGKNGKPKYRPLLMSFRTAHDVYRTICTMREDSEFFDKAAVGVCFSNVFIRISSGVVERLAHSPSWRARTGYDFPYVTDVPVAYLQFLNDLWGDRDPTEQAQNVTAWCEWHGITIAGVQTSYQKALLVQGEGGNGKSEACLISAGIMPKGTVTYVKPQDMGQEYYREMLARALLNVASEVPSLEIDEGAAAAFKALISGDTITARRIRESPFTFRPVAGVLVSLNSLPRVKDDSHGYWRRWLAFTMTRVFDSSSADVGIGERILQEEKHKIVCHCLREAANVIKRNGYTVPQSSEAVLREWRAGADEVEQWLQDRTTSDHDGTPGPELYNDFRVWCEKNGIREVKTSHAFFTSLGKRVEKYKTGPSNARERRYRIVLAASFRPVSSKSAFH